MSLRPSRSPLVVAVAAVLSLVGSASAGVAAERPQIVTVPSTTTTKPPATTTTAPSTTVAPVPTTAPQTKILTPSTAAPKPGDPAAPTTTTPAGDATTTTIPPVSLSPSQVDAVLRDQQRSGASSTAALVDGLRALQNLGMTAQEALALGMGQFPVLGVANWTDDFGDPRVGPPPHSHEGTDVFAAFDTPVRAPVDGTVSFEDAGLGGKGAFVTAPDGTYYYMAHLNSFNPTLHNGSPVKQGDIVGYNGDSGNAKGGPPHVHFEVHPGGGAAVNPKPFLDSWLNAALARLPQVIASFQPSSAATATVDGTDAGIPPILVATGMTRRFSTPSPPIPKPDRRPEDFNHAVLDPLTPPALTPLLGRTAPPASAPPAATPPVSASPVDLSQRD